MSEGTKNVLVALPGSYIGLRLTRELLGRQDVRVRIICNDARRMSAPGECAVDVVEGDVLDDAVLRRALAGIDVAYFPVRFVGTDKGFGEVSRTFAERFRDACIAAGVERIVYLGLPGRGNTGNRYVDTLEDVGRILSASPGRIRTIWLKAGFVIGSGSMLFDVLQNVVQKSPVLIAPRWMNARVSAIGITDLVKHLVRAKDMLPDGNVVADIGLPAMSIREMLLITARIMELRRILIPVPVAARRISSVALMLTTPFSYTLASFFIRILQTAQRTPLPRAPEDEPRLFPDIPLTAFETAVERAIDAIGREQVFSRWTDSLSGMSSADREEELDKALFRDVKVRSFGDLPKQAIFRAVTSIGGEQGWFSFDILWRIRGLLDKLTGGLGTSVGRRVESELRVGDLLDVWKVVDLQENRRLLLEAQMKVFGRAWLEFRIEGNDLIQTAYHYPKGIMGRLYWYAMLPFHVFIFRDMIESIIERARSL